MSDSSSEPQPTAPAPPTGNPGPASPPLGAAEPKPYEEITDPSFATKAAASFEVLPTHGGVTLQGTCPRCTDPMDFPHVNRVYRLTLRRRSAAARHSGAEQNRVPMICTCTADHPGRPEGLDGCGAYWNVTLGAE